MIMEHTGDYYLCTNCKHIWDYNDDACPECGVRYFEEINTIEIKEIAVHQIEEGNRLKEMLEIHDDWREKEPIEPPTVK